MKKKLSILSCILLVLISFSASSRQDPFTILLNKLESYSNRYPTEKIHLHLDKPYYTAGDDIWFKAYVIDSRTSSPTSISNIIYVELIDSKEHITKQLKIPMQQGVTSGDFKLSDTLESGNYRIRAYTQWMRNSGPEFFFDKTIKIGNTFKDQLFTKTTSTFQTINNKDRLTNTIRFTTKNGEPYLNTKVNYEIQLDHKITNTGNGLTNENGELILNIDNNSAAKSGQIFVTINANKHKISKSIPIKTTSSLVDVQFFPEGGSLLENLPIRIGIKAINTSGLGENITGEIIDNDGIEVLKFESTHLGMGSFFLNPSPGKTYIAKVKFSNGSERILPIPKIEKSGYALSLNSTTEKLTAKVMLTPDLIGSGDLQLVAHRNGTVLFSKPIPTSKNISTVVMDKSKFLSGITQFTLFSAANIPVSERIIFIENNSDKINLKVQNLQSNYQKRDKVEFDLIASNNNNPLQGSFSISVTNTAMVTPDPENESHILSSLLLTKDLVGYIEQPNYYFLAPEVDKRSALDNLMLTQGWRKIDWKKLEKEQQPTFVYEPEQSMKISGKLSSNGKPLPNRKVSLFSTSSGFFMSDTLSNDKGLFNFDQITFTDSTKFVIQAKDEKNKNKNKVKIELDSVPRQIVTPNINIGDIEVNLDETIISYLEHSNSFFEEQQKEGLLNRTIMLKEVKIAERRNQLPANSGSLNLNGPGQADAIFTSKDLKNVTTNLSTYLSGRIAGVTIKEGRAFSRDGAFTNHAMKIVLDGVYLNEESKLDDITVQDIESIEVLRTIGNIVIYGFQGTHGLLVITTKRGTESREYDGYAPWIVAYSPKGFDVARQFYSPKYNIESANKPDLRTTIFWHPNLVSDANGKIQISYQNNEKPGIYRMVIEGIDMSGNLAREIYTYQVN